MAKSRNYTVKRPAKKIQSPGEIEKKIRAAMRRRRELEIELLLFQQDHEEIFDRVSEIRDSIEKVETDLKVVARTQFQEGQKRGQYPVYSDNLFTVTGMVKYGADHIEDVEGFLRRFPEFDTEDFVKRALDFKAVKGSIEDAKEAGEWSKASEKRYQRFVRRGKFQTPAITIKRDGDITELLG